MTFYMPNADALVRTFWLLWILGWIGAAKWSARTVWVQAPASRLSHVIPVMAGVILLFITLPEGSWLGHIALAHVSSVKWFGVVATLAGLGWSVWARIVLGRMWSGRVTLKADHRLVERGPYALSRHPIYTGLLLAVVGTMLVRDTVAACIGGVIIAAGLVVKSRQEDAVLAGQFGAEFQDYRRRVRALVPWIW